jgi:hypothetical protein
VLPPMCCRSALLVITVAAALSILPCGPAEAQQAVSVPTAVSDDIGAIHSRAKQAAIARNFESVEDLRQERLVKLKFVKESNAWSQGLQAIEQADTSLKAMRYDDAAQILKRAWEPFANPARPREHAVFGDLAVKMFEVYQAALAVYPERSAGFPKITSKEVADSINLAVNADPCQVEAIAIEAFLTRPNPEESFQPAELQESLRYRNTRLLDITLPATGQSSARPWHAPVEFLKAESTNFVLDDLRYISDFLDPTKQLIGKDQRDEPFAIVLGGALLSAAGAQKGDRPGAFFVDTYERGVDENRGRWVRMRPRLLTVTPSSPMAQAQGVVVDRLVASVKSLDDLVNEAEDLRIREECLEIASRHSFPADHRIPWQVEQIWNKTDLPTVDKKIDEVRKQFGIYVQSLRGSQDFDTAGKAEQAILDYNGVSDAYARSARWWRQLLRKMNEPQAALTGWVDGVLGVSDGSSAGPAEEKARERLKQAAQALVELVSRNQIDPEQVVGIKSRIDVIRDAFAFLPAAPDPGRPTMEPGQGLTGLGLAANAGGAAVPSSGPGRNPGEWSSLQWLEGIAMRRRHLQNVLESLRQRIGAAAGGVGDQGNPGVAFGAPAAGRQLSPLQQIENVQQLLSLLEGLTFVEFCDRSLGDRQSGACWLAREVYGAHDPRWVIFRRWMQDDAPSWLRCLYMTHGATVAESVRDLPVVKAVIRRAMDIVVEPRRNDDIPAAGYAQVSLPDTKVRDAKLFFDAFSSECNNLFNLMEIQLKVGRLSDTADSWELRNAKWTLTDFTNRLPIRLLGQILDGYPRLAIAADDLEAIRMAAGGGGGPNSVPLQSSCSTVDDNPLLRSSAHGHEIDLVPTPILRTWRGVVLVIDKGDQPGGPRGAGERGGPRLGVSEDGLQFLWFEHHDGKVRGALRLDQPEPVVSLEYPGVDGRIVLGAVRFPHESDGGAVRYLQDRRGNRISIAIPSSDQFLRIVSPSGQELVDRAVNYAIKDWRALDRNVINEFMPLCLALNPSLPTWQVFERSLRRPRPPVPQASLWSVPRPAFINSKD